MAASLNAFSTYIASLQDLSRRLPEFIGTAVTNQFQSRVTKFGFGLDDAPFQPYSPAYRLYKTSHGHPAAIVNLSLSGALWGSLTTTSTRSRVKVAFGAAQNAKIGELSKRRPFVGMSQNDWHSLNSNLDAFFGRSFGA